MNLNKPPRLLEPRKILLPGEIKEAKKKNNLVIFIGAGVSRLFGLPSWKELADKLLEDLHKKRELNYFELEQIKSLEPRQILSIVELLYKGRDFKEEIAKYLCKLEEEYRVSKEEHSSKQTPNNIYDTIKEIDCGYVTTNYDELFTIDSLPITSYTETSKKFERVDYSQGKNIIKLLDIPRIIIHLHGYRSKSSGMIVTTKDYLAHYTDTSIQDFLTVLFDTKTVVFLGYGLKEAEILEYILRRGSVREPKGKSNDIMHSKKERKRFVVQGFFRSEKSIYENLYKYYDTTFDADLIGFIKDNEGHYGIETIIRNWVEQMQIHSSYHNIQHIRRVLRNG